MMENIEELFHRYADPVLAWYNGLEQTYQYGVSFSILLIGFFALACFVLSRILK